MNELEEFLKKRKQELRKMKDSDFKIPLNMSGPKEKEFNDMIDRLSKRHQMDVMEVTMGVIEFGMDALQKLIRKKGYLYAKNMIKDCIDADRKGDFKRIEEIMVQIRKDISEI